MRPSLHARLLRLCDLAYDLAPGRREIPATAPPRLREIGLAGPATVIGRNPGFTGQFRDCALVGQIPEGVVVAVRGTQPPRISSNLMNMLDVGRDWLNDGTVLGTRCLSYGGVVHEGFAAAAVALAGDLGGERGVLATVKTLLGPGAAGARVILTGHSKGGPVAKLIAFLMKRDPVLQGAAVEVVSFAAARLGDGVFKARYDAAAIPTVRYEAAGDIVPLMPLGGAADPVLSRILRQFRASPVGDVLGFVPLGRDVVETRAEAEAWAANPEPDVFNIAALLGGGGVSEVLRAVAAHSIRPGSHYDRLVSTRALA